MTVSTDCALTRSNLLTRPVAAAMAGIGAPNWKMSLNSSFSYKHMIPSDSLQPLQIKYKLSISFYRKIMSYCIK